MGYYTVVTGEITIEPFLTYRELKALDFSPGKLNYLAVDKWYGIIGSRDFDVAIRVETETRDGDEGEILVVRGVALVPAWEESAKYYEIVTHMQKIVDQIKQLGRRAPTTFSGRLDGEGEDNSDVWRLKIIDGRVQKYKPQIVWPKESE